MSLSYPIISISDVPTTCEWSLPPLYKQDAHGKLRVWHIGFDGSHIQLVHGLVDGEKIQDQVDIDIKGNHTLLEQAMIRIRSRYMEMYRDKSYRPQGVPVELKGPMLANIWIDNATLESIKTEQTRENALAKKEGRKPNRLMNAKWRTISKYPVWTMPKLDGNRMVTDVVDGQIRFRSRLNNIIPHFDHIRRNMEEFMPYLPPGVVVDGEVYSYDLTFEELTSAVKRVKKPYAKGHDLLRYYIFDIATVENMPFNERYTILINAFNRFVEDRPDREFSIVPLPVDEANSDSDVMALHDKYVQEGNEGLILRLIALPNMTEKELKLTYYTHTRSSGLLKYKKFFDDEATIVDVYGEDSKSREKGCALFKLRNKQGLEFNARSKGSLEQRRKWLEDKDKLLGLPATYRYQEENAGTGKPRFAVVLAIRDYE